MYEKMLYTTLEQYPSLSMYPFLFSGDKYDCRRDLLQEQLVYEEEPEMGHYKTGWSLYSDLNSKHSGSQKKARVILTSYNSENQ